MEVIQLEEETVCSCGNYIKIGWNEGDEKVKTECPSCGRVILAGIRDNRLRQIEYIPKDLLED